MKKILFSPQAQQDLLYWQGKDKKQVERINKILINISVTPFSGLGKPEPLRYEYSGHWSRRINKEHRLIYKVDGDIVTVIKCRYHY